MRFGTAIGSALVAVGILFAGIDSVILFKGWAAYGLDWWDKLAYGTAAASVPWVVAVYPFVWWALWLTGRWRAIFPLVVVTAVYCILIAYSVIGAMGSIATQRGTVIADRKEARESVDSLKDQRNRYRNELGWIAKHRPPDQIAAVIAAEKIKRQWEWTEGCRNITGGSQRTYCTGLSALQGELAAAKKAEELHGKIAALSQQVDGRAPVGEKADPMAASLTYWLNKLGLSSVTEAEATLGLPIATPIVLLIGEMVFIWCGFLVRGMSHKQLIDAEFGLRQALPSLSPLQAAGEPAPLPGSPALPPPQTSAQEALRSRQQQLARWFFAECARPVSSGGLPEEQWYALYSEVCARSRDVPLGLEEFRGLARRRGAVVTVVDGRTFYERILPLMPKQEAPMTG